MIRKAITLVLRCIGIFAAATALLIVGYAVLNWPAGAKYACVSPSELKAYLDYLDAHVSDPLPFVNQQFRTHDIILIGEIHRRKQDVEFIKALIPYLYEHSGITVFAWQFGASDFQTEVDALVNAPEFDGRKAVQLMRKWTYFWNYQEYLDIYHIIWKMNSEIPSGREKIRFLQLGSDYIERKYSSPDRSVRKRERIRFAYHKKMAEIVEREVLSKGKKALWYSGIHHAFTTYRQPRFFFRKYQRGGNIIHNRHSGLVYSICLHLPVPSRASRFKEEVIRLPFVIRYFYPFGGVIDQVYSRSKKPFAFDTHSSPFGKLKDDYSYYSVDRRKGLQLKDFCDGYVVPCSFGETEPVTPITNWIPSRDEFEEMKGTLLPAHASLTKSIPDFLESLNKNTKKIFRTTHDVDRKRF